MWTATVTWTCSRPYSVRGGLRTAWYENIDGKRAFSEEKVITGPNDGGASVHVADVDGDGDPDLLSTWPDSGSCDRSFDFVWHENTGGTFGPAMTIDTVTACVLSAYAMDLDGDGDLDGLLTGRGNDEGIINTWYQQFQRAAGDANLDTQFDQTDITAVLEAGRYRTGEAAEWSEGDWNGDGLFDQEDIVAALATGNYLQGPYAAGSGSLVKPTQDTVDDLFAVLP